MQLIENKGLVPESGVEPECPKARDFKSVDDPATTSKLLNYMGSAGTIQHDSGAQRDTKRGTLRTRWIWFLTACAIATLWGAASLARAESYIEFEISKPVVEGNQAFTALRLSAIAIDQPYFPVYGALVQYYPGNVIGEEPVSGSCVNRKVTTYLCTLEGSYVKVRVYIRPETKTLYVVESTLGVQGPFNLTRKP